MCNGPLVSLGVGQTAHGGFEALVGEIGFALGQRSLLGNDILRGMGLGQRVGLGRFGLRFAAIELPRRSYPAHTEAASPTPRISDLPSSQASRFVACGRYPACQA